MLATEVLRTVKKGQAVKLAPLLPKVTDEPVRAVVTANDTDDAGGQTITFNKTYFGVVFGVMRVHLSPEGAQKWEK